MMTEKTAKAKGYEKTGIYAFDVMEVQPQLNEIKAKGYKAVLVFVPSNPLDRGHRSGGYAVLVEPRYNTNKAIEWSQQALASLSFARQKALEDYNSIMEGLTRQELDLNKRITELIQTGLLIECGVHRDGTTGKRVRLVRAATVAEFGPHKQLELSL